MATNQENAVGTKVAQREKEGDVTQCMVIDYTGGVHVMEFEEWHRRNRQTDEIEDEIDDATHQMEAVGEMVDV